MSEHTDELLGELDRMEELERKAVDDAFAGVLLEGSPSGDGDSDLSDDDGVPTEMRAELAALTRKYRNLRRQVAEDELLFEDAAFTLEPSEGEIWAHSSIDVTVTFCPQTAADYACVAYLEVTGREARLPLQFRGAPLRLWLSLSAPFESTGFVPNKLINWICISIRT